MLVFRKIWRAFLSFYVRFEIPPFALTPTKGKGKKYSFFMNRAEGKIFCSFNQN